MKTLPKGFSLRSRYKSFGYAIKGVRILFKEEHNARIHLLAACLVIGAEAINSAIETLADYVCPKQEEMIGRTKDLAAASVLIFSISAALIGGIIFIPKIWDYALLFF